MMLEFLFLSIKTSLGVVKNYLAQDVSGERFVAEAGVKFEPALVLQSNF